MYRKYVNFIRGISVNRIGQAGVVLTTSSFTAFIIFEFLRLIGVLNSAYIGLVLYLLLPTLFLIGIVLIPIAWIIFKKKRGKTTEELLSERFGEEYSQKSVYGSKIFITSMVFTLIAIIFISIAGYRTLSFMEQPRFCGTACHSVMGPEWATYQKSPHSKVKCVQCHVGEGVEALIESKMSGLRQMILASVNAYSKPVPTPVHQLRPSRETCEKCHWPEKFYGNRLKIIKRYGYDKSSTPTYNTLSLKIDTGNKTGKSGIHWHIGTNSEVRYTSVGDLRREMIRIDVKQSNGSYKHFYNKRLTDKSSLVKKEDMRVMDCVDCHNRATHIYEEPTFAVDDRMSRGLVDTSLPFIKREMVAAITKNYNNRAAGFKGIETHLKNFYSINFSKETLGKQKSIDEAISVAKEIYGRNIHPYMKVDWGTYPNHLGHRQGEGCFRCHNENMVDDTGKHIPYDCTMCHSILSNGEKKAFKYLEKEIKSSKSSKMHEYLKDEFLKDNK